MDDEKPSISLDILNKISEIGVIVPIIWQLEVANVLLTSERRKRITKEQRQSALYALNELPSLLNQLCKFSHKYLKFYPQILSKNEP
jgi:hypothetical protein